MIIKRYVDLDGKYGGFIADIEKKYTIEEKGTVFIVFDFEREISNENLNILPCKMIHISQNDTFSLYEIEFNSLILKTITFDK